ncbi:MAG: hypothetical protein AAFR91_08920 [Pseudomonadota bacterium]
MPRLSLTRSVTLLLISLWVGAQTSVAHAQLLPVAPEHIPFSGDGIYSSLKGWTLDVRAHSQNRIVYARDGFKTARVLSISAPELDASTSPKLFRKAVSNALQLEGLQDVRFDAIKTIESPVVEAFRNESGITDGVFKAWIVTADHQGVTYAGAGLSVISSEGTSVEVFLAEKNEYEHLGGVVVPLARYFALEFTGPNPDVLRAGKASTSEAVGALAMRFEEWMLNMVKAKILAGSATQQTLGMSLGLDQTSDYGLQDPLYDW